MHSLTVGKEGAKKLTLMTKYKVKFFKVLKHLCLNMVYRIYKSYRTVLTHT